jgi:hypothetical protein
MAFHGFRSVKRIVGSAAASAAPPCPSERQRMGRALIRSHHHIPISLLTRQHHTTTSHSWTLNSAPTCANAASSAAPTSRSRTTVSGPAAPTRPTSTASSRGTSAPPQPSGAARSTDCCIEASGVGCPARTVAPARPLWGRGLQDGARLLRAPTAGTGRPCSSTPVVAPIPATGAEAMRQLLAAAASVPL